MAKATKPAGVQISFTKEVKNEIASISDRDISSDLALLSAFIKINSSLVVRGGSWILVIRSENQKCAKLILGLIHKIFKSSECRVMVSEKKHFKKPGNDTILQIEVLTGVQDMLVSLNIYNEKQKFNALPTYAFLQGPEVKKNYLAGAFLASGSVNSPVTSNYHLEIAVNSERHADLIINQMRTFEIEAKQLQRRNQIIVYLKKSEQIADFLKVIGAYQCLLQFENVRIQRDQYNSLNRVNNCDMANLTKAVTNGLEQQKKIRIVVERLGLDNLDPKYRALAKLRLEHPEYSLSDLAEEFYEVTHLRITKSGLNHRLQKIVEIADKMVGEKDE